MLFIHLYTWSQKIYLLLDICVFKILSISDHQQSCGYAEGPWKGPGPRSAGDRWFYVWLCPAHSTMPIQIAETNRKIVCFFELYAKGFDMILTP